MSEEQAQAVREQASYTEIFLRAAHPIVVYDRNAVIRDLNDVAAVNLGLPREGCMGRSLGDFFPDHFGATLERIATVLEAGKALQVEDMVLIEGKPRWFLTVLEPLTTLSPEQVVFSSYEITERKLAERELAKNRDHLDLALKAGGLGTWEWDLASGRVTTSDNVEQEVALLPAGTFDGTFEGYRQMVHEEDFARVEARVAEALQNGPGASYSIEHRIRPELVRGREVWIAADGRVRGGEQGEVTGMMGTVANVSRRKAAEVQLLDIMQQLQLAIETAGLGVWRLNLETQKLAWNDQLLAICGRSREEFRADLDFFREHVLPEDWGALEAGMQSLIRGERLDGVDFRIRRPDGELRHVTASAAPVRDPHGSITHVTGVNIDVTALMRAEEKQRAASRLEAMGTLAGGIAHDFNNVLATIQLQADRIQLSSDLPDVGESAARIADTVIHARDMVRQIMAFSRHEMEPKRSCDLVAAVREARSLIDSMLARNVSVELDLPPEALWVYASPVQLTQLATNLMRNGVAAMHPAGGVLTVSARKIGRPGEEAEFVEFFVRDTGHGMDAATQARIFEPFFTTKTDGESSGMGLAVVHGIVAASAGTIDVKSSPGAGTTFRVTLPGSRTGQAQQRNAERGSAIAGSGGLVLVVEDNLPLLEATSEILRSLGYQAVGHNDPGLALLEFNARPQEFALLLSDVSMPGMSGHELAREARLLRSDLPVLLVTGYADMEPDSEFLCLSKPVSRAVLAEHLARLIRRE